MWRKKWKYLIPAAVLLAAVVFLLWPLPVEGAAQSEYGILATWIEGSVTDGMPRHDSQDYAFAAGSPEHRAIAALLEKATYHRCLATWFGDRVIEGQGGNSLSLTFGDTTLTLNGGREILVNGAVYQMGYWGTDRVQALMGAVRDILEP